MSKTPAIVIQEAIEDMGPPEHWESDLSAGHVVIEALEKYGYKIIRYRVVDPDVADKR